MLVQSVPLDSSGRSVLSVTKRNHSQRPQMPRVERGRTHPPLGGVKVDALEGWASWCTLGTSGPDPSEDSKSQKPPRLRPRRRASSDRGRDQVVEPGGRHRILRAPFSTQRGPFSEKSGRRYFDNSIMHRIDKIMPSRSSSCSDVTLCLFRRPLRNGRAWLGGGREGFGRPRVGTWAWCGGGGVGGTQVGRRAGPGRPE